MKNPVSENTPLHLSHARFILVAGISVLAWLPTAAPVRADWIPTTGTNTWQTTTNWVSGTIDGRFNQTSGADQIVTFTGSTSVGSLQFIYDGGFNMTLQSSDTNLRTLSIAGGITVDTVQDGRTVQIGATGASLPVNLSGLVQDISVAGTDTLVLFNSITGSNGGIQKKGTGTLRLEGTASSFSLGTTLTEGTILVGANAALGTGTVTLNGGRLASSGAIRTMANNFIIGGDVAFGGSSNSSILNGTVDLGSTQRTLTLDNNLTLGGAISGTAGVAYTTSSGTRTITYSAANSYTGTTSVGGSNTITLTLSGAGNLSDVDQVSLTTSTARLNITAITATSETIGGLSGVASSGVTLGDKNLTVGGGDGSATFAGVIAGNANTGSITKIGSGTQIVSGANTYTGGTTVNAGILGVGANATLGTGTVTLNGGSIASSGANRTLANNFIIGGDATFGGLALAITVNGTVSLGSALRTLTAENSITFGNSISGTGGVAFTSGASARTVTLTAANAYTGGTSVGGLASLVLSGSGSLEDTGIVNLTTSTAAFTISGITAASETIGGLAGVASSTVTLGDKNLTVGSGDATATFAGTIAGNAGTGSVTKIGTGTQTFSGGNTYIGPTTIQAGTLRVTGAGTLGSSPGTATPGNVVIFGGATLSIDSIAAPTLNANRGFAIGPTSGSGDATIQVADDPGADNDFTIQGGITNNGGGTGRLIKTGAGKLRLQTTASSFTGGINILEGTVSFGDDTRLGAVPGAATPGLIVINGGTLQSTATVTLNASRGLALGPATGTGSGSISVDSGTTLTYDGIVANNGSGVGRLIKTGDGTLRLATSANTFSGGISILAGTLSFGTESRLGAVPASATPGNLLINGGTLLSTFTLTLNANRGIALGPDTGSGNGTISVSSGTTLTSAAIIANNGSGSGGLIKAGAGRLDLSGTNTYTGPTQVTAGTLAISGSINASSSVSLSGGTLLLGASNVIKNDASVTLAGGTLQTGGNSEFSVNAPGLGALIIESDSTIDLGSGSSTLWFTGLTSITGTLTIENWSGAGAGGGVDQLRFTSDPGPLLGQINFAGIGGAREVFFDNGGNSYYEIVPVPEPSSTALLGAAGLFGLIGFRERRRLLTRRACRAA